MPLSTSYFVPHSPILIERIGKEHRGLLKETLKHLGHIYAQIKQEQPHTVIVLSAHTKFDTPTFNLNLAQLFKTDLTAFGDLITKNSWQPDINFINQLRYNGHQLYDINLVSDEMLDYGMTIPLLCLTEGLPDIRIVPISFAKLPLPEVYRFGTFLREQCELYDKKVCIIATGDLSHRVSKESPNGYSPKARAFDQQVVRAVKTNRINSLTKFSDTLLDHVGQCGIRSLIILGGVFDKSAMVPTILCYEHPFGIGYLTAQCELN